MSEHFLHLALNVYFVFFYKQKTAYEVRISDWSSDVCSADLPQQNHRPKCQPAAHGVHHHGAGEIMEGRTELALKPALEAEIAVPDKALEELIDERDDQQRGAQLRAEPRALGDTAGDDRRNGRGEGQQEEELNQRVHVVHPPLIGRPPDGPALAPPLARQK